MLHVVLNVPQRHAPMRTRMAGSSLAHVFLVSVSLLYNHALKHGMNAYVCENRHFCICLRVNTHMNSRGRIGMRSHSFGGET